MNFERFEISLNKIVVLKKETQFSQKTFNFLISKSLQPDGVNPLHLKFKNLILQNS